MIIMRGETPQVMQGLERHYDRQSNPLPTVPQERHWNEKFRRMQSSDDQADILQTKEKEGGGYISSEREMRNNG
jgi:hypothetical protein